MNNSIELTGADGFTFSAYLAKPTGKPKGRVVVIQEIFGVNNHIREVCDGYAEAGYVALAPALFDRVKRGIELGYEGDDMTQGIEIAMGKLEMPNTMSDVQAAIDYLAGDGKVGVVGYCFGGLLTWLSAASANNIACASGYYGGGIAQSIEKAPKVPTILHFGELDAHIPMPDVKSIDEAYPEVMVYIYDADHGFNCDHRSSFNESAAALARQRTLVFFEQHLR
ncbi:dienelactone hydrolase family protein [Gammaproteobacteria bacterium]|nr:dienelactone hydrolase family protein [Gammaproteobacteria bacterium]